MRNVIPTLKYSWLTFKHKWFVFCAGLKTGAPLWRLVIHDWSKLTRAEAPHYGRQFFGDKSDPLGFTYAWNHHQKTNPHHWEYWIPESGHNRGGYQDREPLPMPEHFIREMVADWLGASRAYEGAFPRSMAEWSWLNQNFAKCRLHDDTRRATMRVLSGVFKGEAFPLTLWGLNGDAKAT